MSPCAISIGVRPAAWCTAAVGGCPFSFDLTHSHVIRHIGENNRIAMVRRKQVYKITYPNGKIYVGMDLTGTLLYLGSPSAWQQIAEDIGLDGDGFELTLRKEILWESETAPDAEVRVMEAKFIRETGANNPAIGYNKLPRYRAP